MMNGTCQFRLGCISLRLRQRLAPAARHPTALAVVRVRQSLRTKDEARARLLVAGAFLDRLGLDFGVDPVASWPKGIRRRSSDVSPVARTPVLGCEHTLARAS